MRRALWLVPPAIAVAVATIPLPSSWIETHYSRSVYLVLERRLTTWTNAIPVALADILIVAAAAALAMRAGAWRRRARNLGLRLAAGRAVAEVTATASAIYVLFVVLWGLNYGREPLRVQLDFDRARVTPAAVLAFATERANRVNELHGPAHEAGWPTWETLPDGLAESFGRVQRQLADVLPATAGVPKRSTLTFYFERAGVSGMTNPFGLEVIVDRSQLPFERPFVAAHEWAHLAGYAREDEAGFVGWLVCLQGPPTARYSAELAALVTVMGSLSGDERRAVAEGIGAGPRRDIDAMREREARVWPWLRRSAWGLYDRYLRANRVTEGVRSYGAAVELMVGTARREGHVPARRPGAHGER